MKSIVVIQEVQVLPRERPHRKVDPSQNRQRLERIATQARDEQDFHEFSYGFRPGRSAHQALRDIRQGLQS